MTRLIVRRSLFAVVQLIGASIIVFVLVRMLPGDPATTMLGSTASPEQVAALQEHLGLDKPIPEQYLIWVGGVFSGDLGQSIVTGNPVTSDIGERLPATLELITVTLLVVIVILIPLGIATARRSRRLYARVADKGVFTYGMLAGAAPDFWLGLMLLYVFFSTLGVAPAPTGRLDLDVVPPATITGSLIIDSTVTANWAALRSALSHLVLPVVTLAFVYGAPILKMTRQTVIRMLDAEFVQQARASGISEGAILRIAFKNSLPPVITLIGVTYGFVVGGAVLVETVFSWGGLGQYAVQAITNADFPAIQGFVLVATSISILVYLLVDVVYHVIDPRT